MKGSDARSRPYALPALLPIPTPESLPLELQAPQASALHTGS